MIEAHRHIALGYQQLIAHRRHGKAFGLIGQSGGIDAALARQEMRHMGIAKQRDAIRAQLYRPAQRVLQIIAGLARQAVHHVVVERGDPRIAQQGGAALDHLVALHAADAGL